MASFHADHRFDHAANDSPRSGGSKQTTPLMWSVVIPVAIGLTIWFATAQ